MDGLTHRPAPRPSRPCRRRQGHRGAHPEHAIGWEVGGRRTRRRAPGAHQHVDGGTGPVRIDPSRVQRHDEVSKQRGCGAPWSWGGIEAHAAARPAGILTAARVCGDAQPPIVSVRQPLSRSEALLEATRRVTALRGGDDLGALNLYSRSPNASPDGSEQVGPVVSIAASRARRPKPRAVAPALVLDRRTYRPHRPGARDLCSGCTQRLRIHALLGESIREHHRGPRPPCTLARDGRVLVARGRAALLSPEAAPPRLAREPSSHHVQNGRGLLAS